MRCRGVCPLWRLARNQKRPAALRIGIAGRSVDATAENKIRRGTNVRENSLAAFHQTTVSTAIAVPTTAIANNGTFIARRPD